MFLLNAALNAPFFLPGEAKYRDSIEGGYASMAHFVSENPNPFGWNPAQYKGLPTQVWYLPVVPYSAGGAIRLLPFLRPEHVYRLVVVTMTTLGPVTLFLFVQFFTRNRRWSLITALLYTFFSVCYGLYPAIGADRGISYVPWRLQVLIKYGEGPHNFGLTLLPLALIACWRAAVGRRLPELAAAAAMLAVVTLTNWIAAVALAWCVFMMLVTGTGLAVETGFLGRRILIAAALAYGLAAFWLTPSYIQTTFFNWPNDAFGYKVDPAKYLLVAALLAIPLVIRVLFAWCWPAEYYLCYVTLCLFGFAWIVSIHYWYRLDAIPESRRYALEVELFCFAFGAEILRRMLSHGRLMRDAAVIGMALFMEHLGFGELTTYPSRTWIMLRPSPRQNTIEYQVSEQLAKLNPRGRVYVFGGTRFRLNSWFLLPQLGGTFESGLSNRGAVYQLYHLQRGYGRPVEQRGPDAVNLLKAAGIEYAAIHGPGSREHWKDINNYKVFDGVLEPVWRQADDVIYRVPFRGLANLVKPEELPAVRPFGPTAGLIEPYVQAIDDTSRPPLEFTWQGNSAFTVRGGIPEGQWITVRVSHEEGWRATQDGQPLEVESDSMGNILVKPRPSAVAAGSTIRFSFRPTGQRLAGAAISAATLAALVLLVRRERGNRR